jgi:hypothetical protein
VLPLLISPAADSIVTRQLTESSVYSADLLAFFTPGPRNPLFGRFVGPIYERFTGNPTSRPSISGTHCSALALFGAFRSAGDKARFFRVVAVIYFVLALGPFLHVGGRYQFPVGGEVVSIPLPYLLLHYIPFVNGVRVPSRFTEVLVFALAALAGYGLSAIRSRLATARWRAALIGVLLVGVTIESAAAPIPLISGHAPRVYSEIATPRESFMVLELPLDWRIIKYHYYQTIHEQRMLVGHPVRLREKYSTYPAGLPLIPLLRDPKLLLDGPAPADARRDAERLAAFFGVRYVIIHGEYLDRTVFETLDRFVADHFPHEGRRVDGRVVMYTLKSPAPQGTLWPETTASTSGLRIAHLPFSSGGRGANGGARRQVSGRMTASRRSTFTWRSRPTASSRCDCGRWPTRAPPPDRRRVCQRDASRSACARTGVGTVRADASREPVPPRAERGDLPVWLCDRARQGHSREHDTRTLAVAFDYVALRRAR